MRKSVLNKSTKDDNETLHTQYRKSLFGFYDKLLNLLLSKFSKVTSICDGNLSTVYSVALYQITTHYKVFESVLQ